MCGSAGLEEGRVNRDGARDEGRPAQRLERHGGSREPLTRTESVEGTHRRTEGVGSNPVSSFSPLSHVIGVHWAQFGIHFPRLPISPVPAHPLESNGGRSEVFQCVSGDRAATDSLYASQDVPGCRPRVPKIPRYRLFARPCGYKLRLFEDPPMAWASWAFCFPTRVQCIYVRSPG